MVRIWFSVNLNFDNDHSVQNRLDIKRYCSRLQSNNCNAFFRISISNLRFFSQTASALFQSCFRNIFIQREFHSNFLYFSENQNLTICYLLQNLEFKRHLYGCFNIWYFSMRLLLVLFIVYTRIFKIFHCGFSQFVK